MTSERGFTLIEMLIGLMLIGILSASAASVFMTSSARTSVWTASEMIGAQVRQTRLKAISRNTTFQIRFNCPAAGQFRTLVMTGTPSIDNHTDRCIQNDASGNDSGTFTMPTSTAYADTDLILQVTGRGVYTSINGAGIPETISVTNGTNTRTLTVSQTGQITFSAF